MRVFSEIRNLTVGNCLLFMLTCLFVSFTFKEKSLENQSVNCGSESSKPTSNAVKVEALTLSQEIFNQLLGQHIFIKNFSQ